MEPKEIILKAKNEERKNLTEAESKELLAAYGIPVVKEEIADNVDQAADKARETGFPVVLKGLGSKLTHKTEMGLVRLNLGNADEVRQAANEIAESAGEELEGFLVQPMVKGRREFVAGLFRDEQFGPVVMFGLGGVFTEAVNDVVFNLAPIDENRASFMLDDLKSQKMLEAFRGEAPVDRGALAKALAGLSKLAMDFPDIAEVDINPLLSGPDGNVTAVDALVILGDPVKPEYLRPPVDPAAVGAIYHPKSIAFVGASATFRKWGHMLFTSVLAGGFEGGVHLVNPRGGEIAGRKVYRSVTEIPEPVDLAVVTVPEARVMDLLPEMKEKGVTGMILITSGFSETGKEGRELEEKLVAEARKCGILIFGPNTMGICNPHRKLYCMGSHARPKPGATAFVSQSGNMGVQLLAFAEQQGIGIRAFGGSGNEAMLTIEDTLDAFAVDQLTKTVLLYIESVKNGRRFFESARKVSQSKPVVVLKGGKTEAGSKAAASHTGALASNDRVFDAACRQAGIVMANRSLDLLDLSAAFSSLPLPKGKRIAVMSLGGGWAVVTADLCSEWGLEVPELTDDIISQIDEILPPYWSRANPVDLVGETDPTIPIKVMDMLLRWDGCDAVINLGILGRKISLKKLIESTISVDPDADKETMSNIQKYLEQFEADYVKHIVRLMEETGKPVLGVSLLTGADDQTVFDVDGSDYNGIFFPTPERAVKVLGEMCKYQEWMRREGL